jgi:hypothetical protein
VAFAPWSRESQSRFAISAHGTQNVGGRAGTLYWLDPLPLGRDALRSEIVISTDPALLRFASLFRQVFEQQGHLVEAALGAGENADYIRALNDLLSRGLLLEQKNLYRLENLSTEAVPMARFALPGPVLTRDQWWALMQR